MAVRSGNFDDLPVLGAILFVGFGLMLNFFSIMFFLTGIDLLQVSFDTKYRFIFSLGLVLVLLAYYLYKDRYKAILSKYEKREQLQKKGIHPIIVFVLYYSISAGLLLLAGIFKNGDWIFSK